MSSVATPGPPPGEHESTVHTFPSSQLVGVWMQPITGSHVSTVQGLLSSHAAGVHCAIAPEMFVLASIPRTSPKQNMSRKRNLRSPF
jgi:hypothetical protein